MAFSILEAVETHKGPIPAKKMAEFLGVSKKKIYAMVRSKEIPALSFAGTIKFDPRSVGYWLRKKDPTLAKAERESRAA